MTPSPPSLPIALGHLDHSPLAVVPYPLWEEDGCLRGHLGEWIPVSNEDGVSHVGRAELGPSTGQGLLLTRIWCLGQVLLLPTWFVSPLQSAIPFLIMVVVLDSNLIVTYIVAVAAGISVAAAFLLPW